MQIKTVSRSSGHSATAKIAYNCRDKITDMRTGEIHKYNSAKMSKDLVHSEITHKDLTLDKKNVPRFGTMLNLLKTARIVEQQESML